MTKLIASLFALAVVAAALPAAADCPGHSQTVQSAPVVTSDAGTAPMTPVPPPESTTTTPPPTAPAPKTGG
jgi:hypothetical protein